MATKEVDQKYVKELSMALHLSNVTSHGVAQYGSSILATLRINRNKNKDLPMTLPFSEQHKLLRSS